MSKWTFLCIFLIFVLKKSCNFLADLIWNKLPPMFAYNMFLVLHVTGTLLRSPRSYIQIKGFDFTTVASISGMAYRWRLHSFSMKIFKCVHKPVDFRVFLHKICRFLCEWVCWCYQSMWNLVCHRSMSGKTCLRLVVILGLPVTMSGYFCQILLYIQWCDR